MAECSRLCKQSHIGGATIAAPHQPEALDWCERPVFGRRGIFHAWKQAFLGASKRPSQTKRAECSRNSVIFVQLGVNQMVTFKIGTSFALQAVGPLVGRSTGAILLGLMRKGIYRSPIRRKFQCEMHLIFHIKSVPGRLSDLEVPNV